MSDTRPAIDWQPSPGQVEPLRGLRDDPGRILLLISAVFLLAGAFLPWAQGFDPGGHPADYTAQEGLAEGFILLVLAMVLAVMGGTRTLSESTSRTVQLLPLAAAVIGFAMWLGADRQSLVVIHDWTQLGGSGSQTIIRYVTGIGLALIPLAVVWLELTRPAGIKAATHALRDEWRISRVSALAGIVAAILGVLFGVIAGAATIALLGPNGAIFAVFISLLGMAVGISVGFGLMRWFRGGESGAAGGSSADAEKRRSKIELNRVERKR